MGFLAGFLGVALIVFGLGFYAIGVNYSVGSIFNVVTVLAILFGIFEFYLVKVVQNKKTWGMVAVILTPIIYVVIIFGENLFK